MYPDYLAFFSSEIVKYGVPGVLERYVFSPEANGNGTLMLARFVGGAVHPMIETGYGVEFGQDSFVANGLAQAALTTPESAVLLEPSGLPEIQSGPSESLSLLREVYDPPKLAPFPYQKERINFEQFGIWAASKPDLGPTIRDIYSKRRFFSAQPRMNFFVMHFLTGALPMRAVLDAVKQPLHKVQLLQIYARSAAFFVLLRGRPRINPTLAMSYPASPAPPKVNGATETTGLGSPWLALLNNAAVHTEAHVAKSIRMLFYCAQHYGNTPAGAVVGAVDANGKETHSGVAMLDGTLFIRVAGVLTDSLGWVAYGEDEQGWDFRGVGWDETWN
ncbi:hypothetical protein K438DRAFT_2006594 [Mycena galopus ATCC 62051]|nr:hypothetical protein K438DRAFT_2006594 [Mycena galopus ATCC 62051]